MRETFRHPQYFGANELQAGVVAFLLRRAAWSVFDGTARTAPYLGLCRAYHQPTRAFVGYARDEGMHSGGMFKNPDYERCLHLSISFRNPVTLEPEAFDRRAADEWAGLLFGDVLRLAWVEPPLGKDVEVWHYRVFCNPAWDPIHPRGEVYSTEFTEAGWRSFSELAEVRREVVRG